MAGENKLKLGFLCEVSHLGSLRGMEPLLICPELVIIAGRGCHPTYLYNSIGIGHKGRQDEPRSCGASIGRLNRRLCQDLQLDIRLFMCRGWAKLWSRENALYILHGSESPVRRPSRSTRIAQQRGWSRQAPSRPQEECEYRRRNCTCRKKANPHNARMLHSSDHIVSNTATRLRITWSVE